MHNSLVEPVQASSLVGSAARAASKAVGWAVGKARADHQTVWRGYFGRAFTPHAMIHHYLYVAVAPARAALRPRDSETVDRARRVRQATGLPDLPDEPTTYDGTHAVFSIPDETGSHWRALAVSRSGMVELLWGVELESVSDGRVVLPAVDCVMPLLKMGAAVRSPEFRKLSHLDRPWRRFGRVDWRAHVAVRANGTEWTDIGLAGPPVSRAAATGSWVPPHGFGVWTCRRSQGADKIAPTFLDDLLASCGYHDGAESIAATIDAARTSA
jgi:hypothetical protein